MVKKLITINVDVDAWIAAKSKVENLSAYLNECLNSLNGRSNEEITKEQLNLEIIDLEAKIKEFSVRLAIAKQSFKDIEEQARIKASEELEKEKFKRWQCGACNHINFMESFKCAGCNLPTQKDPKSKFVNIKGE